ncbi:hypothetical protein BDN67DRAFT_740504 [Paxillus ammoniavirescens]|nr:hypothetical protein BDN67DRAFT_740504 [Paxillus ammoniavirescens]
MAPRTRNATKHSSPTQYSSPGRSTRNSLYGRPPLPPPKPRKSAHGVSTSVATSKARRGMHVQWCDGDEEEAGENQDEDVDMDVDAEVESNVTQRDVTPAPVAGTSNYPQRQVLQTPMQPHPFDAGSVIRTPIKKTKPLQASPTRIGDKGINCLYEQGGVIRERNGTVRVTLPHALGSSANLSRDQVEQLENEQESRIFHEQMEKLLVQKKQLEEENENHSDSGYEDEMVTGELPVQRRVRTADTNGTIIMNRSEVEGAMPRLRQTQTRTPQIIRGPNGELLDHGGRQMLGREGTILVDPNFAPPRRVRQPVQPTPTEIINHLVPNEIAGGSQAPRQLQRRRLGPEGTELID